MPIPPSLSHWRNLAAPIIREVLERTKGQDEPIIRAALRGAYPFGLRKYHPYKIWCDEIQRQRGLKPKDPRQTGLFDDERTRA